jgi:mRNA interferase YafQ
MLVSVYSSRFLRDLKRCEKRGQDLRKLEAVISDLQNEMPLDTKHRVHPLHGEYKGYMECHIGPDWLLIYSVDPGKKKIYIARTGTHDDLF